MTMNQSVTTFARYLGGIMRNFRADFDNTLLTLTGKLSYFLNSTSLSTVSTEEASIREHAEDLSEMEGYAAYAGTTGGTGRSVFYFYNSNPDGVGSFSRAVENANAAGGIVSPAYPTGLNVLIDKQIVIYDNVTICDPWGNVTLWKYKDVTGLKVVGKNVIIKDLAISSIAGDVVSEKDGIWVDCATADKVWVHSMTLFDCGDGCIDIVTLQELTSDCRVTVSNCRLQAHDKVALVGSLVCYDDGTSPSWCPLAKDHTTHLFVTFYKNSFSHVGQRNPKVFSQAMVHVVNNVFDIQQVPQHGALGGCSGVIVAMGGKARVENNVFSTSFGEGYKAIDSIRTTFVPRNGSILAVEGEGCITGSGNFLRDNLTEAYLNELDVPQVPYTLEAATVNTEVLASLFRDNLRVGTSKVLNGDFTQVESDSRPDGINTLRKSDGVLLVRQTPIISPRSYNPADRSPYLKVNTTSVPGVGSLVGGVEVDASGLQRGIAYGYQLQDTYATGSVTLGRGHAASSVEYSCTVGKFAPVNSDSIFTVGFGGSTGSAKAALSVDEKDGTVQMLQYSVARSNTLIPTSSEISVSAGYHTVHTGSVETINWAGDRPLKDGQRVLLLPSSSGAENDVTLVDNSGNIRTGTGADVVLQAENRQAVELMWAAHLSEWIILN